MEIIIVLKNGFIMHFCDAKNLLVSDTHLEVDSRYTRYHIGDVGFKSVCVETYEFPLDLIHNWNVRYVKH